MQETNPGRSPSENSGLCFSAGGDKPGGQERWGRLPAYGGHCNRYLIQVPEAKIGYVNAVLESYEWIARIQTVEMGREVLEIRVPGDWEEVFQSAMARLSLDLVCLFRGWERGMPRQTWGIPAETLP